MLTVSRLVLATFALLAPRFVAAELSDSQIIAHEVVDSGPASPQDRDNESVRRILHIDADAFFAAIEQRDDPRLRGKPIAVAHDTPRGVVTTASYEARRFGVGSAMPSRMARERCPQLIFVPPRFNVYREVGKELREVFGRYTDLIEPLSIDEAYLDVTEPKKGPRSGTVVARLIKDDIRRQTGLTVSAGVSYCKFLAKLASGWQKPDGLTVFTPDDAPGVIASLPVERIHGVGPRTAQRMHALGIRTGADLRRHDLEYLVQQFGKVGRHFHDLAHGRDEREVDPDTARKSVSSEETFAVDLHTIEDLSEQLPGICDDVARRLERNGLTGRGVVVKLKGADHSIETRRLLLPYPVMGSDRLLATARYILEERFALRQPVRLLGVGVYELQQGTNIQPPLFPDWNPLAPAGRSAGASGRLDS